MFENQKSNDKQLKNSSQPSLIERIKNLSTAKKIAIPAAFIGVVLLGAKILDTIGAPNSKQAQIVAKTPPAVIPTSMPATTAPTTTVVSSTAPTLSNNGAIGSPPLPMPTGSIALSPDQKPDPNLTLKKESTAELDELKSQIASTNAKLDALTQQVSSNGMQNQQQIEVKKIYPHYTNKPIKRKTSSAYAEVGDRRWDADSSYLVK